MNYLERLVESWPVEQCSAAVVTSDAVTTAGDGNIRYELASVTKLLSTYAVLIAIEEGAFALDTPCGSEGATVRHLLAHASGVGFRSTDACKAPEQRRIYSSYGFELLADVIAHEADMPFAQYLDEAVCQPLGMTHTQLWGSAGHESYSTVNDLVFFAREILQPSLIAQETLVQACTVQFPELHGIVPGYGMYKPCPWGLGFEIKGEKNPHWTAAVMPHTTVGHFGQAGTYLWVDRESQRAMVALTNRSFGDWAKPLWAETNAGVWKHLDQLNL